MMDAVEPFQVLTWSDVARKADVPPTTIDIPELRLGYAVYASDPELEEALRWFSWEFGFGERPPIPEHLQRKVEGPAVQIIAEAVERGRISQEFVEAWGRMSQLFGWYNAIILEQDAAQSNLYRALAGKRGQSTKLQEHWYARWIRAHAKSLLPRHRYKAEDELAELCFGIAQGRIAPVLWPKESFTRMLKTEKKVVIEELKSTYRDLSANELHTLLNHEKGSIEELPPVDPKLFPRKSSGNP